jgi:hypothetical protein
MDAGLLTQKEDLNKMIAKRRGVRQIKRYITLDNNKTEDFLMHKAVCLGGGGGGVWVVVKEGEGGRGGGPESLYWMELA